MNRFLSLIDRSPDFVFALIIEGTTLSVVAVVGFVVFTLTGAL